MEKKKVNKDIMSHIKKGDVYAYAGDVVNVIDYRSDHLCIIEGRKGLVFVDKKDLSDINESIPRTELFESMAEIKKNKSIAARARKRW